LKRRRGEVGEGGKVVSGAMRWHEVGEVPGPTGRRWAADTSPVVARSGGWRTGGTETEVGGGH
jgi:hypothetical protein